MWVCRTDFGSVGNAMLRILQYKQYTKGWIEEMKVQNDNWEVQLSRRGDNEITVATVK